MELETALNGKRDAVHVGRRIGGIKFKRDRDQIHRSKWEKRRVDEVAEGRRAGVFRRRRIGPSAERWREGLARIVSHER
jgi:hypothetical protein